MAASDFVEIVFLHLCNCVAPRVTACYRVYALTRVNSGRLLRTMGGPSCGAVVRLPQPGRWGRFSAPASAKNPFLPMRLSKEPPVALSVAPRRGPGISI